MEISAIEPYLVRIGNSLFFACFSLSVVVQGELRVLNHVSEFLLYCEIGRLENIPDHAAEQAMLTVLSVNEKIRFRRVCVGQDTSSPRALTLSLSVDSALDDVEVFDDIIMKFITLAKRLSAKVDEAICSALLSDM